MLIKACYLSILYKQERVIGQRLASSEPLHLSHQTLLLKAVNLFKIPCAVEKLF